MQLLRNCYMLYHTFFVLFFFDEATLGDVSFYLNFFHLERRFSLSYARRYKSSFNLGQVDGKSSPDKVVLILARIC